MQLDNNQFVLQSFVFLSDANDNEAATLCFQLPILPNCMFSSFCMLK